MPITVNCPCQNSYRVKDELAGKRIKCPHCQQAVDVPQNDSGDYAATDSYQRAPISDQPDQYSPFSFPEAPRQPLASASDPQAGNMPYPQAGSGGGMHSPYDASPYQAAAPVQSSYAAQPKPGVNTGAIFAGLGMMVGAIVWFVAGLFLADRIFFYPPILFIFGIVSLIKGLLGTSE
jgi:hypothetical protein